MQAPTTPRYSYSYLGGGVIAVRDTTTQVSGYFRQSDHAHLYGEMTVYPGQPTRRVYEQRTVAVNATRCLA